MITADTVHTTLLVDGQWRQRTTGTDTPWIPVRDPADVRQVVGYALDASTSDVDDAVRAAAAAHPAWAALSVGARAEHLRAAADRLADGLEDRTRLLVAETGKVLAEARLEMARFEQRIRDTADLIDSLDDIEYPPHPRHSVLTRSPLGVVGLIVPWNWPLSILGAKLPQALLAGNTVVVKPSPEAPLAAMATLAVFVAALPPGTINAVPGGTDPGMALVTHPTVRKIDFTGGTESGRAVMAAAAANLTRVTLELGGNDPALVLADARVDEPMLRRLAGAAFATSGQVCMAVKRVYVHHSRVDEVVHGLCEVVGRTVVGPGLAPRATMGPLRRAAQLRYVRDLLDDADARGATVHRLGRLGDAAVCGHGHFMLPVLVTDLDQSARLVRCEQFGPVLPILAFDDEDEALAMANDSHHGLCSSVWTSDLEHGMALARRLQAGTTYLNHHGPAAQDDRAPFGGIKHSGIGSQLGRHGVQEFTSAHVLTVGAVP